MTTSNAPHADPDPESRLTAAITHWLSGAPDDPKLARLGRRSHEGRITPEDETTLAVLLAREDQVTAEHSKMMRTVREKIINHIRLDMPYEDSATRDERKQKAESDFVDLMLKRLRDKGIDI